MGPGSMLALANCLFQGDALAHLLSDAILFLVAIPHKVRGIGPMGPPRMEIYRTVQEIYGNITWKV